jgi:signal recognition particle subunit SRP19
LVGRDEGKLVIWPHYFDRNLSREQGRRVPMDLAIETPKVGSIAQAARTLGMKPELEDNARPPSRWSSQKGRVLVPKTGKKEDILKQIARRL